MNPAEGADTLKLMNRLMLCNDMQEILNLSRPVFGNPLILTSIARVVVAITKEDDLHDDHWTDLQTAKSIPLDCLTCEEIADTYKKSIETGRPVHEPKGDESYSMLRKVLMINGGVVGYLESPLYFGMPSNEQVEFFDCVGNLLALRFHEDIGRENLPDNMLDYFVFDLLEGKITNVDLIEERLRYFGWDIMKRGMIQIVSIRWMDRDDPKNIKFRHLAERLIQSFANCKVFVYGMEIKMVCQVDRPINMDDDFMSRLEEILSHYQLSAGVSRVLNCLDGIADFNLQAKKASAIGKLVEPEKKLHFYDRLCIYYALELACETVNPGQFIHSAVLALWDYDREHDSNLLESLRVYLTHHQSIGESAAALFIHRNTMNYRISKINELTHLDLDDPDVLCHLLFSFYVYRFRASWTPEDGPSDLAFQRPE